MSDDLRSGKDGFDSGRRRGISGLDALAPLVRSVLWRRSYRVYDGRPIPSAVLERIERAAMAVPSVMGNRSGWVELVSEPSAVREVLGAATGGLVGKTNWWLKSANPAAFLLALGDEERSLRIADRWMYNVDVALAGEAAVLAAADEGVGSCWMAAIDERSLRRRLGLDRTRRIVAVISLGYPRATGARSLAGMWDRLANRLVSSRRKLPEEIHFLEHAQATGKLPRVSLDDRLIAGRRDSVLSLVEELVPSAFVTGEPLEDRSLAWMLESVRQAPSADNSQIWRLLFVRSADRIGRILRSASAGRKDLAPLAESRPGALVVAAATKFFISHRTAEQPFYLIDVPIGLLHLLLAARHFGLAFNVVWDFDYQAVAEQVGLRDHRMVALVLLGQQGEGGDSAPWVQLRCQSE